MDPTPFRSRDYRLLEAGGVAAAFGVTASVVSGGVLCVAGVLTCGAWLPRFVHYDARHFRRLAAAREAGTLSKGAWHDEG